MLCYGGVCLCLGVVYVCPCACACMMGYGCKWRWVVHWSCRMGVHESERERDVDATEMLRVAACGVDWW